MNLIPSFDTERKSEIIPDITNLVNKFNRVIQRIRIPINSGESKHQYLNKFSLESSKLNTPLMVEVFKKQLDDKCNETSRLYSQLNHMRSQLSRLEELRNYKITCQNNINLTTNFTYSSNPFLKRQKSSIHFRNADFLSSKKQSVTKIKIDQKSKVVKNV